MDTFQKIVHMINSFKEYYIRYDQPIYENPSPGNKRGGITTLEEKSLGCIQKGGHAVVTDTLEMGQVCCKPGLNLMTGPGNDSVSITNLLASQAQVLLFTTGRGNPLGTAVPTIKIASNSACSTGSRIGWTSMPGRCWSGDRWTSRPGAVAVGAGRASGRVSTRNEENNDREIMLFKDGVIL